MTKKKKLLEVKTETEIGRRSFLSGLLVAGFTATTLVKGEGSLSPALASPSPSPVSLSKSPSPSVTSSPSSADSSESFTLTCSHSASASPSPSFDDYFKATDKIWGDKLDKRRYRGGDNDGGT
jgi:hypothetical protein